MDDFGESSLLGEAGSLAPSTLERATLTRRSPSTIRASTQERELTPPLKAAENPGESSAFWALICVMVLLAVGNLILTFFVMGVLRLGSGMESIEFIPGDKSTRFYGTTDLGNIQKEDGSVYGFSDAPFSILGDNSKISLSLRTKDDAPLVDIAPEKTEMKNIKEFKVIDPSSGANIFSTKYPSFGLPKGVNNLNVKRSRTSRIASPTFADLEIRSDSTIRVKGNEGLKMDSNKMTWAANQDIYLRSMNGSIVLDGGAGVFIEVNTIPLAGPVNLSSDRGQYKVCVCMPKGQLYRIPIPADNNKRREQHQINCATFVPPCTSHA